MRVKARAVAARRTWVAMAAARAKARVARRARLDELARFADGDVDGVERGAAAPAHAKSPNLDDPVVWAIVELKDRLCQVRRVSTRERKHAQNSPQERTPWIRRRGV